MRRLTSRRAILLAVALAGACGNSPEARANNEEPVPARGSLGHRLDDYLQRAETFGFAGVVLVDSGGEVVLHRGYGAAIRERQIGMSPATVHAIGSVTKQFTGAAIMALVEDGRISLDDEIGDHLPEVPETKSGITIHHLLTHTAGIRHAVDFRAAPASRDEAVRQILEAPHGNPPGEQHRYSNAGYALLGAIVERASGRSYERFLDERLFQPAGLTRTGYARPSWDPDSVAHGYGSHILRGSPLDRRRADDGSPGWHLLAGGGLLSTAGDMHQWVRSLLRGRVLSTESVRQLWHPHVPETPEGTSHYGYGWAIFANPWGTPRIAHNGSTLVSYTSVRWYPVEDVIIIYATNHDAERIVDRQLPALVFHGEAEWPPTARVQVAEDRLRGLAGVYRLPNGERFQISTAGNRLAMDPADPEVARMLTALEVPTDERDRARRAESLAAPVLDGLARGDLSSWEPVLSSRLPVEQEPGYWQARFQEWKEAYGSYAGARVVGSRMRGDYLDTYVLLVFENGRWLVRLEKDQDGRFDIGVFISQVIPERFTFVAQSATEFATYNSRLGYAAYLSFDRSDDAGLRAVFRDAAGRTVVASRMADGS